ncbi:MAG: hypothetical protein GY915_00465 [bacterium]|nr:hypothetical protein [bacterium]
MTWGFALDIIVVFVLLVSLFYGWRLQKRLQNVYNARGELKGFLDSFTHALSRTEQSIEHLKFRGQEAVSELQEERKKAQALRDELSFFLEKGETVVSSLESTLRQARNISGDSAKKEGVKPSSNSEIEKKVAQADSHEAVPELLRSLKGVR